MAWARRPIRRLGSGLTEAVAADRHYEFAAAALDDAARVELDREQPDQVRVLSRLYDAHGHAAARRADERRVRTRGVETKAVDGVALQQRVRVADDDPLGRR